MERGYTQRKQCAGKHLIIGSQEKPLFVVLADFHGAKTPTTVDFKQPIQIKTLHKL